MNNILTILRVKYLNEYLKYRSGVQTFEEYQECLKPLDNILHNLALQNNADPLEGIPVLRDSSSNSSFNQEK